jgi:hypothetical protein
MSSPLLAKLRSLPDIQPHIENFLAICCPSFRGNDPGSKVPKVLSSSSSSYSQHLVGDPPHLSMATSMEK